MKLEYFEEPNVILLYGDDPEEAVALQRVFMTLAEAPKRRVALHGLPFVESVDDCRLQARSRDHDAGVEPAAKERSFKWILTTAAWDKNASLMTPFCEPSTSDTFCHVLNEGEGPSLIFSLRREW